MAKKCWLFAENADISKIKRALVLKGTFSETKYACVLSAKFHVYIIILTSFRQGWVILPPPSPSCPTCPTSKRITKKPTQIKVTCCLIHAGVILQRNSLHLNYLNLSTCGSIYVLSMWSQFLLLLYQSKVQSQYVA